MHFNKNQKGELKGRKLLEKYIKYKPNLDNLIKSEIDYMDFNHIRNSLDLLQQMKKNIFAMISQQGPLNFLVTFTSVEHRWTPLVNTLAMLHDKRKKRKHIETIEDCNINYLIRNNPVTYGCYYRHMINALKKMISQEKTFFGEKVDFYFDTEFQNRGSECEHGLLWVENAPIYGVNSNNDIENFVDNYLTCNIDHLDPKLAKIHEHHHTKSCKKIESSHCRYNLPMPPMRSTKVLELLGIVDETFNEKEKMLYNILEKKEYDNNNSFD